MPTQAVPPRVPTLSPRLDAIVRRIPRGARLADVGTDHALVPIAALAGGRAASAIGIDRSAHALARARDNARRAGVAVDLRLGDGLTPLAPHEADTLVVAGIGGCRTIALLERADLARLGIQSLLLAPHRDLVPLRRHVLDHLGPIEDEILVADGRRWYVVLLARLERPPGCTTTDAVLGPSLRRRTDETYAAYVHGRLAALQDALNRAPPDRPDPRRKTLAVLTREWARVSRAQARAPRPLGSDEAESQEPTGG